MLLNNEWVNEKITGNEKYMEISENENTTVQNLWGEAKAILRS